MSQSVLVTHGIPAPGSIGRIAISDIVRRSARRYPDRIALIEEDIRLTFAELDTAINRFAHFLLGAGLVKGDRVASLCANSFRFVIAMFAIHKAGLIWVPINTGLAPDDVRYILEHSEARFAVVDDTLYANPALRQPLDQLVGKGVLVPIAGHEAEDTMIAFADALAGQSATEPEVDIDDRDVAQILYTSGTTGQPKGVMQSHLAVYIASLGNVIELEARGDDVAAAVFPLFHCAQHTVLCSFLHIGAASVILRGFDAANLIAAIARERVSFVPALPLMWSAILDHPARAAQDLTSLRLCMYGRGSKSADFG